MQDKKPVFRGKRCFHCGHCVAVCPAGAVESDVYPMEDVETLEGYPYISGEDMLRFVKARRSVRRFKKEPIPQKALETVLQAGRFSPTGSNLQDVSFIVVQEQRQALRGLVVQELAKKGDAMLADPSCKDKKYAFMWKQMAADFAENPEGNDTLLFHAPTVVLILAQRPISGHLAAAAMELTANACGLGVLYSGFITSGLNGNVEEAKKLLPIPDDKEIVACLLLGQPAVSFKRTAPRKPLDVHYM